MAVDLSQMEHLRNSVLNETWLHDLKARALWSDKYIFPGGTKVVVKHDSRKERELFSHTYKNLKVNSQSQQQPDEATYYVISEGLSSVSALIIVQNGRHAHLKDIFTQDIRKNRFRLERTDGAEDCYAVTFTALAGNTPHMLVTEQCCAILDKTQWQFYAEMIILNAFLGRNSDYYILHAGAVSTQDKAIVLCGKSHSGKTTLTYELVKDGFKFLSDELACIHLTSGDITPFPRNLGCRYDMLERFPELNDFGIESQTMLGEKKWRVDLEQVYPGSLGRQCKAGYLIFLHGFAQSPSLTQIPKSKALLASLGHCIVEDNSPIKHILRFSDVLKEVACYELVLGNGKDNVNLLKKLVT